MDRSIIISVSSDIGEAIANDWIDRGDRVVGTYRSKDKNYQDLQTKELDLVFLDMLDKQSIAQATTYIADRYDGWDKLVLCPASIEPIGKFDELDFDLFEESILLNFTAQMRVLHALLPSRNKIKTPTVIFFAGGGTNNAPLHYLAYTIAKIATIKMTELLDAEFEDVKFVIYGPGWVKTKIHEATLKHPKESGANYEKTLEKLSGDTCTSYEDIIDAINWGVGCDKGVIGGRNISIVSDQWGSKKLEDALKNDANMYKLRRDKNDWS